MEEYTVLQDQLRQELLDYYSFINSRIEEDALEEAEYADDNDIEYDEDSDELLNQYDEDIEDQIIDDDEFEAEQKEIDDYILNEWNNYVNRQADNEFVVKHNTDHNTSNQIKLMIMVQLYEFVSCDYSNANDNEKHIYDLLNKDLCPQNAINLYNEYSSDVLETYSYFMRDSITTNKYRIKILDNNLIDNIVKINPASILDYRILMGIKFEDEYINSVKLGKTLLSLVEMASMMYQKSKFDSIYEAIQYIIDDDIYITVYINSNWNYLIANIYEHLLNQQNHTIKEQKFMNLMENNIQELYRNFYDIDNYREQLIYEFYLLNQDKFGEEELYELRCNTEKKGKEKVLAISPYYIEEQSYFKNRY